MALQIDAASAGEPPLVLEKTTTTTTSTTTTQSFSFRGLWGSNRRGAVEQQEVTTTTTASEVVVLERKHSRNKTPVAVAAAAGGVGGGMTKPSEAHPEVFASMQARIEKDAPEDNVSPFNETDFLDRFLVARNLDVEEAFKMWQVHQIILKKDSKNMTYTEVYLHRHIYILIQKLFSRLM